MKPAPKKKKKSRALTGVSRTILSIYDLVTTFNTDGSITISGLGSPVGAAVDVTIDFDSGGNFVGTGRVEASGIWTTGPINIGTSSGPATVTATATADTFPDQSAVTISHISVPAFRVPVTSSYKSKPAAKAPAKRVRK